MKPAVSIIVLNWNGRSFLEKFLPSLLATRYPNFKIFVADNGSTDGSLTLIRTRFPEVELLDFQENLGFTSGNNKALEYIQTPYFALVNSDVEVDPDWLTPLVDKLESDEKIAAVQPKVLAWHARHQFEYAGAAGGFMDWLGYPFCRGRIFQHLEEDLGQYDTDCEIAWATGACTLIRKSVTDQIGLFEPIFFAHMEEIDFCWRARNHGYSIACCPSAKVWHVGGGTLNKENPQKTFLNFRNSLMTLYLNLPSGQVIPKIFLRLCLDGIFALKSALGGNVKTIPLIFKAHWAFYAKLSYLRKRRKIYYPNGRPQHLPSKGILHRLIVFRHFLMGVNSFKEIEGHIR
jgi:GT2 family glycosyltransferase